MKKSETARWWEQELPWKAASHYDGRLPRYTSYPTAPVWDSRDGRSADMALARIPKGQAVSVYVHIPFCQQRCLYCGCNVVVGRNQERATHYVAAVQRELQRSAGLVGRRPLAQLHFGGGTPTYLKPAELVALTQSILNHFSRRASCEQSIEVDPRVTTREHIEALAAFGFNRISLGVQDFDAGVQAKVGRRQGASTTSDVVQWARSAGFDSVNIDLMYGLPGQDADVVRRSAEQAAGLGADRVALFGYAHMPTRLRHQRALEQYGLPEGEGRWAMFMAGRRALGEAGYLPIGMDHYALPGDELARAAQGGQLRRNFQGYTVLGRSDLIGLGASAISNVGGRFLQNHVGLDDYLEAANAERSACVRGLDSTVEDRVRGRIIEELMCTLRADVSELARLDATKAEVALALLEDLEADGLVVIDGTVVKVTELGRPLVRHAAAAFDAYLEGGHTRPLSRVV